MAWSQVHLRVPESTPPQKNLQEQVCDTFLTVLCFGAAVLPICCLKHVASTEDRRQMSPIAAITLDVAPTQKPTCQSSCRGGSRSNQLSCVVHHGDRDKFKTSLVCILAQAMLGSNDALLGSGPTFDQSVPLPPLMMYDLAQPCCRASHPRSPRHSCLVQSSSAMIPFCTVTFTRESHPVLGFFRFWSIAL